MTFSTDPKPGRWILPLIILAMVGFTYVFVSSLEEQVPTETEAGLDLPVLETTTTTLAPVIETTTTTEGPSERDLYAEEMQVYLTDLLALNDQFQAINSEFESQAVTFSATEEGMEATIAEFQTWYTALTATLAPASEVDLQLPHQDILDAGLTPVQEAEAALEGLRGPGAEPRQQAVIRLADAVTLFEAKVNAAVSIAGTG